MSKNKGEQYRRQRARLFRDQNGLCFWCKEPMILFEGAPPVRYYYPPNMCTTDHLDHKWSPERGKHNGELRKVAACFKCNQERGENILAQIPRNLLQKAARGFNIRQVVKDHVPTLSPLFEVIEVERRQLRATVELPAPESLQVTIADLIKKA